jgi:hypothetical protein
LKWRFNIKSNVCAFADRANQRTIIYGVEPSQATEMTSNPLSSNTASDVFTVSNGFDHKANNDCDNSMRHRSRPPSYSSVVKATSSPADSSGLDGAATNDTGYAGSSYFAGYSAASDEHQSYSSKSRNDHLPYSAHPSADNLLPYSPNPNANHNYLP